MARLLEQLYYLDENMEPVPSPEPFGIPKGARYQVSQFVCRLRTDYFDMVANRRLASASMGYDAELVLAMVRPTWRERLVQLLRYGSFAPLFGYSMAVLKAAVCCERCGNSMRHRYGLGDGYRKGSAEWERCGTSCEQCMPH